MEKRKLGRVVLPVVLVFAMVVAPLGLSAEYAFAGSGNDFKDDNITNSGAKTAYAFLKSSPQVSAEVSSDIIVVLQGIIDGAKAKDTTKYTPGSVAVLAAAISAAEAIVASPATYSDANAIAAGEAITAAIDSLEDKATKVGLKAAIDAAREVDLTNALDSVKILFQSRLAAAESVYANDNATQAEVDRAFADLNESILEVDIVKGSELRLRDLVNRVQSEKASDYTQASFARFTASLNAAREVLTFAGNYTQKELDEAYDDLSYAYRMLVKDTQKDPNDPNGPNNPKDPNNNNNPTGNASDIGGKINGLEPGASVNLPGKVTFPDGSSSDVNYEVGATGDTGSATYDPKTGKLTGKTEGTVTVTIRSKTDPTKTYTISAVLMKNVIKIRTPLTKLYIKAKASLAPPVAFDGKYADGKDWSFGETAKLTWAVTSGAKVVSVNAATGKIKALKKGKAKVTATALNGKKLTFTVNVTAKAQKLSKIAVKKAPKAVYLKNGVIVAKNGKPVILATKLTSAKATGLKVTFKSSKTSVLKVDKAGKLYAGGKKGKAKITVNAGGKKTVITIQVK